MIEVNYLAVLLAAVASMVVGFVWYSEAVLGKPWMKLMGYTKESLKKAQKEMGMKYVLSFVSALVTAYMLTHIMGLSQNLYHNGYVMTGITSGFFVWFGFVGPVQMTDVIFGKDKWSLYWIKTGHQLVSLIVMGVVIGLIG